MSSAKERDDARFATGRGELAIGALAMWTPTKLPVPFAVAQVPVAIVGGLGSEICQGERAMNDPKACYRVRANVAKQLLASIAGIIDEAKRSKQSPTWGDCGSIGHVNEQLAYIEAFLNGTPDDAAKNLAELERQMAK